MSRMTMARKLPEEVRARVLEMIRAGIPYRRIAEELGHPVSPQVCSAVKTLAEEPVPTSIPGLYRVGHSGVLVGEQLDATAKPGTFEEPAKAVESAVRASKRRVGRPRTLSGAPSIVSSPNTLSGKAPGRARLTGTAKLRHLLRKALPLDKRAALLVELAQSEDPRISIRALSILADLEAEAEARNEDRAPAPLFVLPKGSRVSVQPYSGEGEDGGESDRGAS